MTMLVTLNEMKAYLGIPTLTTTHDAFLTAQIELVSESIESYCSRIFDTTTYTEKFYVDDESMQPTAIFLRNYPVISITSITDVTNSETITNYKMGKSEGKLVRLDEYDECVISWFSNCAKQLQFVYSAGYATTPLPVKFVVYEVVESAYNKKINGISLNFGKSVQRIGIPGVMSIDFDYNSQSSQTNKTAFGAILQGYTNILDQYKSERPIIGGGTRYVS